MFSNKESKKLRKMFTPGAMGGGGGCWLHNNGYEKSNLMQLSLPKGQRYIAVSLAASRRKSTQVAGAFKEEKRPREDGETADYAAVCF